MTNYRFSGHETFPCRYTWLPKAFAALQRNSRIFSDEERAIVELGVGKNMVRAIRFWVQVTGVAEPSAHGGYEITPFGKILLGTKGLDRFLEDRRTLWLLHWKLLSHVQEPLFAWDYLINRWTQPEISREEVVKTFELEAKRIDRKLSHVTLEQHFDVFLHTYTPTRSRKGEIQEDNLDCPLVELELIKQIGERNLGGSERREPVYAFRREPKPDITPELFIYCLYDYWQKRRSNEATLTFRDVSVLHGSIGQVFKLPEMDVRERLERLEADSNGLFIYQESAALQRVTCSDRQGISERESLRAVYQLENFDDFVEIDAESDILEIQNLESVRSSQGKLFADHERVAHD